MFLVGDKVVHRVHGAGIITGRREKQLTKTPHRYLVMEMVGPRSTLMVPIDKAGQCLRPLSKMTTLRHLLMSILAGEPDNLSKDYKERAEQTGSKLKSGKIEWWIEVVRDLTHLKEQRPLGQTDRRGLNRAMHLLASELALAQRIDLHKAESRLALIVEHPKEFKDQQAGTRWLRTVVQRIMRPFTQRETQAPVDAS